MRRVLALVSIAVVGVVMACSSFGQAPETVDDAGVDAGDAAACTPPVCGAPSGRCGMVNACGLEFSCGDCAPPFTCVNGSCQCSGATNVCKAQGATCGALDNGCGTATTCGDCQTGTSCQLGDAGLACASGACVGEPKETVCAARCSNVTDNCGELVSCAATCTNGQLCAADGKLTTCGCPARPLPIKQYYDGAGHFCYTQQNACPGSLQGPIARIYATNTPGLVKLYRCAKVVPGPATAFLLTTHSNCENAPGFVLNGSIGACSPTPVCGAQILHRYAHKTSGDITHGFGPAPMGYVGLGDVCYAWAN